MPRIAGVIEARRAAQEGQLARQGTYLVYLEMVRERVNMAADIAKLHGLLDPADEYIDIVLNGIRRDQAGIAGREAQS